MPIINKGIFEGDLVYIRQTGNDWPTAQVTTTSDVLEVSSNLYFTAARANAVIYPSLTTANVIETNANLYFTTARANAAIYPSLTAANIANFISTVNATVQPFLTTANVIETSGNLYFTVGRVNATVQPFLTTANVVETSGNLYFTIARVNATVQPFLTTANVVETAGNLYFTNTKVFNAITIGIIPGSIAVTGNLAANGLVIRSIDVTNTVLAGNVVAGTSTSNIIIADSITSNTWNGLYTANVIETSGNLYYTNARARTAFTAGTGIAIDSANGIISTSGSTLTLNATQRIQSTGANTYTLNAPISTPESILVIVEGLVQIPAVDYTVSGTTLTLSDYPILNSNIEVRYYGADTIYSSSSITTKVDSFIGTGANIYTLSINPPSKDSITVIVNGVYRQSDQYTIDNKVVTFNVAPAVGANVDIRIISGIAGTSYNTRRYTANGTSNTFVITDGFTQDTILVFENGITQVPGTDYTVIGNIVYLATAPAANIVVQIRELGVTGISGANVVASIRGLDQTTGNLIPTIDVTKNLGSSTYKWNNSYVNQSYVTNVLILNGTTISTTGSSLTLVSGNTTATISGPLQSSRLYGLALIFGG